MRWFWAPVFFWTAACSNPNMSLSTRSMAETNLSNLTRIETGMDQLQVLQIMHKPYRQERLNCDDGVFDVWFYVTRKTGLDQSYLVRQNLTPLVFKNGVLVAWGYDSYSALLKHAEKCPEQEEEELCMSCTPRAKPSSSSDASQAQQPQPQEEKEPEKGDVDEKGEDMLEQENEQNFDFW